MPRWETSALLLWPIGQRATQSSVARAELCCQLTWRACRGLYACSMSPSPLLTAHRTLHSMSASLCIPEWQSTFSSKCGLRPKALAITWSLLETQFQAPSKIYWTRICIWTRFASDFMHVQICHTLVYKTESTVKKKSTGKNISL